MNPRMNPHTTRTPTRSRPTIRRAVTIAAALASAGAPIVSPAGTAHARPGRPLPAALDAAAATSSGPGITCADWAARENRRRTRVIVTATCTAPSTGYRITLAPHEPQGINPRVLLLDLHADPPDGPAAQVLTPVALRYRAEGQYDRLTILPDGPTLDVLTPRWPSSPGALK